MTRQMVDYASGPAIGYRTRARLSRALAYTAGLMIAALVLVPILYVALGGFRTTGQLAADPAGLPDPWVTSNYTEIATSSAFWGQVGTSTLIAVLTTAIVVALGALAAFPLARFEFRGRETLYLLFTLGLLFPISVAILPIYLMLRDLYLLDTALGVALPQAAFGIPVTIVILRPFMRAIPGELEDAAAIDGCSKFGFFLRILLPLSRPALMTVSILAFVGSWNGFLLPLLVLSDPSSWTLPLGVANYSTQYSEDTARILAFTGLSMLPALAFFLLAERRIVGGLSGAVKG
ncbi:carbohydrate ABC transporter permease [Plantactinospora soyae]|uniref:Raffinose/stachyose/melibiose transport system permease protein n=1 Tax=Plantactinospora soyae TaxID=1544732 RepID=A0A927MBC1_9ACTN|nr:carbohydrate ABC transporter permease [Plantactinospora soyae]MBE1488693.1 raffinose/stachyose/melibiose transport system permease protein [Plantactinospora soyae]